MSHPSIGKIREVTKIKICGITRLDDALYAAQLGADALGFVFYPGSPRHIEPQRAGEIIESLPPFLTTVGVFVNEPKEGIQEIVQISGVDVAQLHGDEPPGYCEELGMRVIKAFQVSGDFDLEQLEEYDVDAYLLDTYDTTLRGGTGRTFNWEIAKKAKAYGRIILAGGLTPENVGRAMEAVRPYAVDVSSGVEKSPGVKGREKVRRFLIEVRKQAGT